MGWTEALEEAEQTDL